MNGSSRLAVEERASKTALASAQAGEETNSLAMKTDNFPIGVTTNCKRKGGTHGDGNIKIEFNLTRTRRFPRGGGGLQLQFPSVRISEESFVNINSNVNRGGWW